MVRFSFVLLVLTALLASCSSPEKPTSPDGPNPQPTAKKPAAKKPADTGPIPVTSQPTMVSIYPFRIRLANPVTGAKKLQKPLTKRIKKMLVDSKHFSMLTTAQIMEMMRKQDEAETDKGSGKAKKIKGADYRIILQLNEIRQVHRKKKGKEKSKDKKDLEHGVQITISYKVNRISTEELVLSVDVSIQHWQNTPLSLAPLAKITIRDLYGAKFWMSPLGMVLDKALHATVRSLAKGRDRNYPGAKFKR